MPFTSASFTIVTASPTSAIVHGLSPPTAPMAVMNGNEALVGSSVACKATARIFDILRPSFRASARLFDEKPENRLIAVHDFARIAEIDHQRRNRLSSRVIIGNDLEDFTDVHLFQSQPRV